MRTIDDVAPAGVGMVWLPRLHEVVDPARFDVVEIEPQVNWTAAGRPDAQVRAEEHFFHEVVALGKPTLVHSVGLPLANADAPPAWDLARLVRDVAILQPQWVSEHLSFDNAVVDGRRAWTGFLLPPPQTPAAVRVAAARLRALRDAVARPVAFETGVNYFSGTRDVLDDGAFFAAVAQTADCGILLDLHNLWANERNGRIALDRVLDALPLERVWEVHVAGGHTHRGVYLDAHAGLVDPALLAIVARVVPRLPQLRALMLEAVPISLRTTGSEPIVQQLDALREIWQTRGSRARATRVQVRGLGAARDADVKAVARHENRVASAVARVTRPRDDDRVALVAELVRESRGGVLLRALPLTVRLLMTALGADGFIALLERYAARVAPQRFPNDEARAFRTFLESARLDVPYVRALARLDAAMLDAAAGLGARSVPFPTSPAPVLDAVLARRMPPPDLPMAPHAIRLAGGRVRVWSGRVSPRARSARASAAALASRTSTRAARVETASW